MKTTSKKLMEKVATEFATLMISKIEEIQTSWSKPWFTKPRKNFLPQNLNGRRYKGGNILMLLFHTMGRGFLTPVFLTFKQAQAAGIRILKGEHSFPVYYYIFRYYNPDTKEVIDSDEYEELDDIAQDGYILLPVMKHYNVFNIEQTNYPEIHPDKWEAMQKKFRAEDEGESEKPELFSNDVLDNMLFVQSWVCPVIVHHCDSAYFIPSQDHINMPEKQQFKEGEAFYSTLLHEMGHSTGTENRLNRLKSTRFGSPEYAKEELVAELTAALTGYLMGISSCIREENAAYLKSWIKTLKEKPEFLLTVLQDTIKAVQFICDRLGISLTGESGQEEEQTDEVEVIHV